MEDIDARLDEMTRAIHKAIFLSAPKIQAAATHPSLLKPSKDSALPSSYTSISLQNTVGKLFEKSLLSRIMAEINSQVLLRDEQFRF